MPAAAAAMANWAGPRKRGTRRDSAMPMKRKVMVHSEFSSTLPKKLVVMTAYQEQISASTIVGTMAFEIFFAVSELATLPSAKSTMAHCAAKQSSATVATERPTMMLESHVSNKQMRCTSVRGRTERKAQPST